MHLEAIFKVRQSPRTDVYGRPANNIKMGCLGLFQGRSIIHAVARHGDDVADAVVAILLVGLRSGAVWTILDDLGL